MSGTVHALKGILAKIKADPDLSALLRDTADLVADVGLDSLQMLQFMLEIEASLHLQIDFDALEYDTLRSIQTLAAFLDTMPVRQPATGPN
jgi:acyl carrier protein